MLPLPENESTPLDQPPQSESAKPPDPRLDQVYHFLVYGLSLPERALRATSAMLGGTLRETASLVVPQAFQDSRSYKSFIKQMLNFVTQDVGGVSVPINESNPTVQGYVAKKAISSFVDLAGMATIHVSPLTILAIVSDLAYGSQTFLKELSAELKKQGVIPPESTIDNTAELLAAVSRTSASAAEAFDSPPLDVEGLKETIRVTRESLQQIDPKKLLPQQEIQRLWNDMRDISKREGVGILQVATAVTMYSMNSMNTGIQGALTTARVSRQLFNEHVFNHYSNALAEIRKKGLYSVLAETSQPYVEAVWYNFQATRPTVTADLMSGRLVGKAWEGLRGWLSAKKSIHPQGN